VRFIISGENEPQQANIGASEIMSFFKSVNNDEFDQLLEQAVDIILSSERIIFVGAGTSGALAKYGARSFLTSGNSVTISTTLISR
jgi:DNA-binding MurR/RpiR family transcriptional regulator